MGMPTLMPDQADQPLEFMDLMRQFTLCPTYRLKGNYYNTLFSTDHVLGMP